MEEEEGKWARAWARRRQRSSYSRRLWVLVDPYRPPPRLLPILFLNVVGFYSAVVAAAVTEQLYKEKYWDEHPGQAVPLMRPTFYFGSWRTTREDFAGEESK